MENSHILPVLPTDAAILTQISFASKRYWKYPEEWIEQWWDTLTITPEYLRQHAVYKLEKEGKSIGFCAVEQLPAYFEIGHLWILPTYIGQGLGKKLLLDTLKATIPAGATVRVLADPSAEAFYQKQGLSRIGQEESWPKGRFLPLLEKIY